jgi:hypothetical protein
MSVEREEGASEKGKTRQLETEGGEKDELRTIE